jgi:aryl-alcohol dehydrogenase-like predicted oxidoreductase
MYVSMDRRDPGGRKVISEIDKVSLGKTSIRIPPLGIGIWSWGDRIYWGYGRDYGEADIKEAFETCIQAGINFFDTAEAYGQGRSERLLGQFLGQMPPEVSASVIVATKFFPYPWRLRGGSLKGALRDSLKRLERSKIELYQIHQPFPPVSIETWAPVLADVLDEGLADSVGVSNYNANQMRRAHTVLIKRGFFLTSNQVEYNLLNRRIEKNGLLALCQDLGITCIAYGPIAQGVLSGKYTSQKPLTGLRGGRYPVRLLNRVEPLIHLLREIGSAHDGKTPAQVAINWVMCKGAVPIPGVKNIQQAHENIGALGWRLQEDEVAALDEASDRL